MTRGTFPPRNFPFTLNGRTLTLFYYLVDAIYPPYGCFVTPDPSADRTKKKMFNKLKEALRKDVERLYGVLTSRWHIMLRPCRYNSVSAIVDTATAAAILHNLITELRRDGYVGRRRSAAARERRAEAGEAAGDDAGAAGDGGPDGEAAGHDSGAARGAGPDGGAGAGPADADVGENGSSGSDGENGLPPPEVGPCAERVPSSFVYQLMTGARVKYEQENGALRTDLMEHDWSSRRQLLVPSVDEKPEAVMHVIYSEWTRGFFRVAQGFLALDHRFPGIDRKRQTSKFPCHP